jgi:hypothetical protein
MHTFSCRPLSSGGSESLCNALRSLSGRAQHVTGSLFALALVAVLIAPVAQAVAPTTADEGNATGFVQGPLPGTRGMAGAGLEPWETIAPAPVPVSRPAGAVVDGLLYVIGGEESGGARNGFVQIYDPDTDSWDDSSADTMPTPVSNLCAAALDGLIYVPGGWTGGVATDALQVFNPATSSWETMNDDPLPAVRAGSACAAHDGRLYVFGGFESTSPFNDTWVYDPQEPSGDRWTVLTPSPFNHTYAAALSVNGLIFVAGISDNASGNFDTVGAYDPDEDEWIIYPSLQQARGGAGMWGIGTTLYVGGGGWSSYLTSVEMYDTTQGDTGTWEFASSLTQGRRTFAYATDTANSRLFAAAGWAGAFLNNAESTEPLAVLTVLSVTPDSDAESGGTPVTISGSNFDSGATVTFGGENCTNVIVVDENTITCDTPPGTPGTVDVTVENPDTESSTLFDGFTYTADPDLPALAVPTFSSIGLMLLVLMLLGFGVMRSRRI